MTDVLRDERPLSDARLRQLFDANVIGIVITDNRGAFIEANDAFLRMIGYTRAELAAGTDEQHQAGSDSDAFKRAQAKIDFANAKLKVAGVS